MSLNIVARLVSGLPFAMGPCGVFFGRLMKSAECLWASDNAVDQVHDHRKLGVLQLSKQPVLQQIVVRYGGRGPVDDGA